MARHSMELRHLVLADRHLIENAERIGQQEALVATLDRHGHDTTEAVRLLRLLRGLQEQSTVHRLHIREALKEPEQSRSTVGDVRPETRDSAAVPSLTIDGL